MKVWGGLNHLTHLKQHSAQHMAKIKLMYIQFLPRDLLGDITAEE